MKIRKLVFFVRAVYLRVIAVLPAPFLLAVRAYWGWQFMQTGWGKLHNLDRVTDFFTSLGLPLPHLTAIFISSLELVGGLLLVLGLLSRMTALLLSINMVVAYITADRDALLAFFSDPDKFYAATPFTFLFASLIVLVFGAGLLSLDTLVWRRVEPLFSDER